ncbi:MAG: GNAT family N-acetyltransferase [Prolixibacteraceae bacterium]|jgi:GNAT superfamily N-acetyltransferase|nr:GNAT family N-acetyltransferase [Prolixibacteraceae bacterium]
MGIRVRKVGIPDLPIVVNILNHIPEFDCLFYTQQMKRRLDKCECVILLAEFAGKPVGCKIAYNRYFDGSVYSWLGGVLPPFRGQGVAKMLQEQLEKEAKRNFFQSVRLKTRNKHKAMLIFALKSGFYICGFEAKPDYEDSRIELVKYLNGKSH